VFLPKIKESSRIFLRWIRIVDVPKLIQNLLVMGFDHFDLFFGVLVNMGVFLAGCFLELVGLDGFFGHITHLAYSAFSIGSSKVIKAEQEFHYSCELILLI